MYTTVEKNRKNDIGKSARIINNMKTTKICVICYRQIQTEDLIRSRSLNRLGLPEARENTLLYITSDSWHKI